MLPRIIIVGTAAKAPMAISNLFQWTGNHFRKMVNSIAFYPAFIAFLFLGLSYLMIYIDFSETGKQIKAELAWLQLKDASTARSIISVIAAGILSLTVFTFTMVMVILNQAAAQMSNRVLDKLIGNRYQQIVLGCYIGTIVYSLFLLSAIRDIDSGIYVPSLSTYLLIAFAVIDIFLFIYFLHYITQSVKYNVIIRRICKQTQASMAQACLLSIDVDFDNDVIKGIPYCAAKNGVFEGFAKEMLLREARQNNMKFSILVVPGTYVLEGTPVLSISHNKKQLPHATKKAIDLAIFINDEESIENNYYYGFRQLAEVAIKALSPGINDPGTAIESLRALTALISFRMGHFAERQICDEDGIVRITTTDYTFDDLFANTIQPIWQYGKNDRFVQRELEHLLTLLLQVKANSAVSQMLAQVRMHIAERNGKEYDS